MRSFVVSLKSAVFAAALFVALLPNSSASALTLNANPGFDSGLSSWFVVGDVNVTGSDLALIGNADTGGGVLQQSTLTGPGSFSLSFDLRSNIAPKGDPNLGGDVFGDLGIGTLYLSDTLDLSGNPVSPVIISLFDADSSGVSSVLAVQTLGSNWFRYSLNFLSTSVYVTTVFELIDLDFVENSSLEIDNVELTARGSEVPEPATLSLLGVGFLPLLRRVRKR